MKKSIFVVVLFGIVFLAAGCTTKRGTIYLATDPPGATIYVNKVKQGETPLEFQWDSKIPATLTIEKEGYETEKEQLDKAWLVREHRKGNYDRYYENAKTPSGDATSTRLWKVRTTRDLVQKKGITESQPSPLSTSGSE